VAQAVARLNEAQRLGFIRAFVAQTARRKAGGAGMALTAVGPLTDRVGQIAAKLRDGVSSGG